MIDGKKFDLRIYVLVTQVTPQLTAFIYKEGLARFATENYTSSANENLMMHLTNYAINKDSEKFKENEANFKWKLSAALEKIAEMEGQDKVDHLWTQIQEICIKTLLMGLPHFQHNYKSYACKGSAKNHHQCFQILGFDVLLDKKLKPFLLEVNESASFNDDTDVDKYVKGGLITDTFRLLNIKANSKQKIKDNQAKGLIMRNKLGHMTMEEIEE